MKLLKIFFYSLFFFVSFAYSQNNLIIAKKIITNDFGKKYKGKKIVEVNTIDLNGDGKNEYILKLESKKQSEEIWLSSDKKYLFTRHSNGSINYNWFINLDNDKTLELISAIGEEDGIDYSINKFNKNLSKIETLFYFNPIIKAGDKYFWGYPLNIKSLILQNKKMLSSPDSKIERDDQFSKASKQTYLPCLFFSGSASGYEIKANDINYQNYKSLDEIKAECSVNDIHSQSYKSAEESKAESSNDNNIFASWRIWCTNYLTQIDIDEKYTASLFLYSFNTIYINVQINKSSENPNEYEMRFKNIDTQTIYQDNLKKIIEEDISKTEPIATFKVEKDKLALKWTGLFNVKTQSREFVEDAVFVRENEGKNPIIFNRCKE